MNGTGDVGIAARELSTLGCSVGGTIATTSRCRSSVSAASTRDRIATPSSSSGKMLRNP